MSKALVSGATSNIGIALVRELIDSGYDVYAIVRPDSANLSHLLRECPDCQLIKCDLGNIADHFKETEIKGLLPFEEFYHLAWNKEFENARYNYEGQKINLKLTEEAFRFAALTGCRKFIGVGSQAECGIIDKPINSETPDDPQNGYGRAKCEAYDMCCSLSDSLGVDLYWGRILSAYGAYGVHNSLINLCLNACLKHETLNLTKGEQIWDFVYADDIARALRLIAKNGVPRKKYTISSGVGMPLVEYIRIVSEVFDYPKLMNGIGKRKYSKNELMYLVGDVSETEADTGMVFDPDFRKHMKQIKNNLIKG